MARSDSHFFAGGELSTCSAWNPVFFNLKLSRGVVRETFHILKTPTWESAKTEEEQVQIENG